MDVIKSAGPSSLGLWTMRSVRLHDIGLQLEPRILSGPKFAKTTYVGRPGTQNHAHLRHVLPYIKRL